MKTRALRFLLPSFLVCAASAKAQTAPDTWGATDALGRNLPLQGETFAGAPVPAPRQDRFVGMFFFLWLGESGQEGPFDITKILKQDPDVMQKPDSPLWGPQLVMHHWGESAFGYYVTRDEWVLRRQAQMLSDAGVDTVIFDVTNQLTYPRSYLALCKVWSQMRREGNRTPQIAFLAPFGAPSRVVKTLYEDFYKPGVAKELWFQWKGKPLIMADPNALNPADFGTVNRFAAGLDNGATLGQSFHADSPFTEVGGSFPTWETKESGVTLSLFDRAGGKLLASQKFQNVADNSLVKLDLKTPLPAGDYYLEQSKPQGRIGWWSASESDSPAQSAFVNGQQVSGQREVSIRYQDETTDTPLKKPDVIGEKGQELQDVRDFFTFRKPQASYFEGPTGPNQWGWLEVTPQHIFKNAAGENEQMTVGVAQNAVDGRLGVLSNPTSYGRSFHNGAEPAQGDFTGRNFSEQWARALEVDPQFLFVTGWNEWIAMRFPLKDNPFYGAGPVSFVDEFNAEHSRDIEPVQGAHGDDYYYQLVSYIRRYKGARAPEAAGPPQTIKLDGKFDDWKKVAPEYRDDVFDTTPRNEISWNPRVRYTNTSGRNDFESLKLARDAQNLYAYARTRQPIVWKAGECMSLELDTDCNAATGWMGFDFRVVALPGKGVRTALEKWEKGAWKSFDNVPVVIKGNEMEVALSRRVLGLKSEPLALDFKWTDNVDAQSDALNLYRNGDTAPNGCFKYRFRS